MADVKLRDIRVVFKEESDPAAMIFGQSGKTPDDEKSDIVGQANYRDGRIHAIDGVDLDIKNGESIAILGPSGCGKSTMLRVVAGLIMLDAPNQGEIEYGEEDWTRMNAKERRVGIVFQNYALYPHMHSKKNLGFFFKMHKREEEVDERVEIVSKMMGVGFDQLLDRRPKALSGGQQQRVAIARCIVRDPTVFLFDEPLSNLDAKLRTRTRVEIKRLLRRFNITTVYVTHDQTEAQAMGDRIAVMQAGTIQQLGTYREIYDNPANMFVAGFVGAPPMNLIAGKADNGGVHVDGHFFNLRNESLMNSSGDPVYLGVRPEDVNLFHEQAPDSVPVDIYWVEDHYSEQRKEVTFDLGGTRVIAKRPLDEEWDRNATVFVTIPSDKAYVFSADESRLV
jgi:ABC-type sugar transport system ATPase subunit